MPAPRMVTHLFNAQSQIGNREPGVVGATLDLPQLSAGLIADGIHVHPASLGMALRAKRGPGQIFLVTDAMSITGTDWESFDFTGRTAYRKDGALRLADGTLAGADLTMINAIRYVHRTIGVPLDEVLRMAALYPGPRPRRRGDPRPPASRRKGRLRGARRGSWGAFHLDRRHQRVSGRVGGSRLQVEGRGPLFRPLPPPTKSFPRKREPLFPLRSRKRRSPLSRG